MVHFVVYTYTGILSDLPDVNIVEYRRICVRLHACCLHRNYEKINSFMGEQGTTECPNT